MSKSASQFSVEFLGSFKMMLPLLCFWLFLWGRWGCLVGFIFEVGEMAMWVYKPELINSQELSEARESVLGRGYVPSFINFCVPFSWLQGV